MRIKDNKIVMVKNVWEVMDRKLKSQNRLLHQYQTVRYIIVMQRVICLA